MVRGEVRSEETLPEALTPSLCLLCSIVFCVICFVRLSLLSQSRCPEYSNHNHLELSLELRHLGSLSSDSARNKIVWIFQSMASSIRENLSLSECNAMARSLCGHTMTLFPASSVAYRAILPCPVFSPALPFYTSSPVTAAAEM